MHHLLRKKSSFFHGKTEINLSLTLSTHHYDTISSVLISSMRTRNGTPSFLEKWCPLSQSPGAHPLTKSQRNLGARLTLHYYHLYLGRLVATYSFPVHCGSARLLLLLDQNPERNSFTPAPFLLKSLFVQFQGKK